MSKLKLIEAVKTGDLETVSALIKCGENSEQTDEYGWTALNWASGQGQYKIIQTLLDAGANVVNSGRDNRTPYQIALAAAHVECAKLLQQSEQDAGIGSESESRPYCKAYPVNQLREFSGWHAEQLLTEADAVVYLHQDHSVTASMWHGEDVVFSGESAEWKMFCTDKLEFTVPSDLDLVADYANNRSVE